MNAVTEEIETPLSTTRGRRALLLFVRVVLPVLIVVAGLLLAMIGQRESAYEVGALLISAGLSVALLNVLYRIGVKGDSDRGTEASAREYFDRTGHWPGE